MGICLHANSLPSEDRTKSDPVRGVGLVGILIFHTRYLRSICKCPVHAFAPCDSSDMRPWHDSISICFGFRNIPLKLLGPPPPFPTPIRWIKDGSHCGNSRALPAVRISVFVYELNSLLLMDQYVFSLKNKCAHTGIMGTYRRYWRELIII